MMNYLARENLFLWLDRLQTGYEVFVPFRQGEHRYYRNYTGPADDIVITEARTAEPVKGFFMEPRQKVAELFNPEVPAAEHKAFAVVGVKACDLQGFLVQDQVFGNHRRRDPLYQRARDNNLIVSADCSLALDTCFCLALGVKPYPEASFDINLSELEEGFIVEIGSAKGRDILAGHRDLFEQADPSLVEQREQNRRRIITEVEEKIEQYQVPHRDRYDGIIERNYESSVWRDEAQRCVECGACNTICPTCHCFCLVDRQAGDHQIRFREWDSCMFKDFARVAGGANPRPQLWMRLRNRFEKKFDFFPKVANFHACTGCGRCISACPAKIDIRHVLRRLVDDV